MGNLGFGSFIDENNEFSLEDIEELDQKEINRFKKPPKCSSSKKKSVKKIEKNENLKYTKNRIQSLFSTFKFPQDLEPSNVDNRLYFNVITSHKKPKKSKKKNLQNFEKLSKICFEEPQTFLKPSKPSSFLTQKIPYPSHSRYQLKKEMSFAGSQHNFLENQSTSRKSPTQKLISSRFKILNESRDSVSKLKLKYANECNNLTNKNQSAFNSPTSSPKRSFMKKNENENLIKNAKNSFQKNLSKILNLNREEDNYYGYSKANNRDIDNSRDKKKRLENYQRYKKKVAARNLHKNVNRSQDIGQDYGLIKTRRSSRKKLRASNLKNYGTKMRSPDISPLATPR